MKRLVLLFLHFYQHVLAFVFPANSCRFYPSCSTYAIQAVERFGVLRGCWMGMKRLSHCHPWHEGGFDPVPESPASSSEFPSRTEHDAHRDIVSAGNIIAQEIR